MVADNVRFSCTELLNTGVRGGFGVRQMVNMIMETSSAVVSAAGILRISLGCYETFKASHSVASALSGMSGRAEHQPNCTRNPKQCFITFPRLSFD